MPQSSDPTNNPWLAVVAAQPAPEAPAAQPNPWLEVAKAKAPGAQPSANPWLDVARQSAPEGAPSGDTVAAPDGGTAGPDLAGAVGRGLRSAVLPWSQTKAELEADPTISATLTKAATNLAAGMGITATGAAALGAGAAATGLAVPALALSAVAAGLYGLYSGLGYEHSRSKAEGKDPSLARGLAAAALEINPLVKSASRTVKLLRVAAQVAGATGLEYAHSESPQAAGVAAVVNVALSPLMYLGMRPMTPKSAEKAAKAVATDAILSKSLARVDDELAPANRPVWLDRELEDWAPLRQAKVRARAERLAEKASKSVAAGPTTPVLHLEEPPPILHLDASALSPADVTFARSQLANEIPSEFAAMLVNQRGPLTGAMKGNVKARVKDLWFKLSPQQREDAYRTYRFGKVMAEELGNELAEMPLGKQAFKDISAARQFAAPALYVGRRVSEVTGLPLEDAVVGVMRATDRYTLLAAGYFKELAEIEKLAKAHKVTPQALFHAITDETGEAAQRIPEALLTRGRAFNESLRDQLVAFGYRPEDAGLHYMPTLAKTGFEAAEAVRTRLAEVQHLFGTKADWFAEAAQDTPEALKVRELIGYAQRVLGDDVKQHELYSLPEAILDRVKSQPGWTAGAVLTKRGDLPQFIQEQDAFKLWQRYIHGNFKGAVIDPALKQVQAYQQALETAGMRKAAAWVSRYAETVSGDVGAVSGRWSSAMERMRDAGAQMLKANPDSVAGKTLQGFPEALARLSNLAYPAHLVSPRAWGRNLLQSYGTLAPELGGTYGYGVVTRGLRDAYATHGMSVPKMKSYLEAAGQLGDITSERGVQRQALGPVGKVADFANEKLMLPFQWTDLINRSIAMHSGKILAQDLAKGVPGAVKAIQNASRGLRNKLSMAKSLEEQAAVLGDYLVSKTQFRYGKAATSALVREMGPVFGQFSMWPQMAAWDLVDSAQHRNWARKLTARLAPLGLLLAVREGMDPEDHNFASDSAVLQYFVGDPTELSPYPGVLSTGTLIGGGPIVKGALGALPAAAGVFRAEDTGKALGQAGRNLGREVLKNYVPPLSSVVNELDKVAKARDRARGKGQTDTPSREWINATFGGPKGD